MALLNSPRACREAIEDSLGAASCAGRGQWSSTNAAANVAAAGTAMRVLKHEAHCGERRVAALPAGPASPRSRGGPLTPRPVRRLAGPARGTVSHGEAGRT